MKTTRLKYHKEIKKRKFEERERKYLKLLDYAKDNRKFFKNIKQINGKTSNFTPSIANQSGLEAANVFAQELANNQNSTVDQYDYDQLMSRLSCESSFSISSSKVIDAVGKISKSKVDVNNISSSVIKLLGNNFIVVLTSLYNSFLTHSFFPDILKNSTFHPIPKHGKKNVSEVSSYRFIAIISVFLKILDYIVLSSLPNSFNTNNCQFGYKPGHSTKHAAFILKETVNYYLTNNNDVFACFLDATKAFDRVEHVKLFINLLERDMPPILVKLYYNIYSSFRGRIFWDGCFSGWIFISIGVLQGGVSSPIFFLCYIDSFYTILKDSGFGCKICHIFLGLIAFADDHVVLAPSSYGLRRMLDMLYKCARTLNITFNPDKSHFMHFTKSRVHDNLFTYNSVSYPVVDVVIYLGIKIAFNLSDDLPVFSTICNSINFTSSAIGQNIRKAHYRTLLTVFKAKCSNFYGIETTHVRNVSVFNHIETTWNKSVRRLLLLPYRTHRDIINFLTDTPPLKYLVFKRIYNFILSLKSTNSSCRFIYHLFKNNSNSFVGNNHINCMNYLAEIPSVGNHFLINELLDVRFGLMTIPHFSYTEICTILNHNCVH